MNTFPALRLDTSRRAQWSARAVRPHVLASLDRFEQLPPGPALRDPMTAGLLREQQLEWFDSGIPAAIFQERFDDLSAAEGGAVLAFLEAFRAEHAADFPFDELDVAIDRHWASFRGLGSPGPDE